MARAYRCESVPPGRGRLEAKRGKDPRVREPVDTFSKRRICRDRTIACESLGQRRQVDFPLELFALDDEENEAGSGQRNGNQICRGLDEGALRELERLTTRKKRCCGLRVSPRGVEAAPHGGQAVERRRANAAPDLPLALEARVWLQAASLGWHFAEPEPARASAARARELFRQVGDRSHEARCLVAAALAATFADDDAVDPLAEEAKTISRELGDRRGVYHTTHIQGLWAMQRNRLQRAQACLEESLELARELRSDQLAGNALCDLGVLALYRRRHDDAVALFVQSLESAWRTGFSINVAYSLRGLGGVAAAQGNLETAARLLGAAEGLQERTGDRTQPYAIRAFEETAAPVWKRLSEPAVAAAWAAGGAMSEDEAVSFALRTAQLRRGEGARP